MAGKILQVAHSVVRANLIGDPFIWASFSAVLWPFLQLLNTDGMTSENVRVPIPSGAATPELHHLKSQVDNNEDVVDTARNRINNIFATCDRLREPTVCDSLQIVSDSVQSLAIKLETLRISTLRIKLNSLDSTIASMRKKVNVTRELVDNQAARLESEKKTVSTERDLLESSYNPAYDALSAAVTHLETVKMKRIHHQISCHAKRNFLILRDIVFGKSSDTEVRLFQEPIIELRKFMDYKFKPLNRMLHNMIMLQNYLSTVLGVYLPYLQALMMLLPTFENVVEDEIDIGSPPLLSANNGDVSASMIRLGQVTKLPLSSKTINNQRRESHRKLLLSKDKSRVLLPSPPTPSKDLSTMRKGILETEIRDMTTPELLKVLYVISQIFGNFACLLQDEEMGPRSFGVSFRKALTSVRHLSGDAMPRESAVLDARILSALTIKIYKIIISNHPQDGRKRQWPETGLHEAVGKLLEGENGD